MNKRQFIKHASTLAGAAMLMPYSHEAVGQTSPTPPHSLPALGYAYDALEPYIDKATMEIHHGKHHSAYVNNLNKAVTGTEYQDAALTKLFANIKTLPAAVRNNAGGHWNHSLFWTLLQKNDGTIPANLKAKLEEKYMSIEKFKDEFAKAAIGLFGSGWVWLMADADKKLTITTTSNQDNPLMDLPNVMPGKPILALDVWEHAYYLKYQNKRADYVSAFWNVVNWAQVSKLYDEVQK
ncbi:MAG: superoxide dismutase [Cytophagales bacterium]|nr:superoxide dismutase [Cytophagales bacterium]